MNFSCCFFTIFMLTSCMGFGNVSSLGLIHFDAEKDENVEMTLSSNGLKLGSSGVSQHGLDLRSSLGYGVHCVSSNVTLGANAMVMADSASNSLDLWLPEARRMPGRLIQVYKVSENNYLKFSSSSSSGGNIIHASKTGQVEGKYLIFGHATSGMIKLLSYGEKWYLLESNSSFLIDDHFSEELLGAWSLKNPLDEVTLLSDLSVDEGLYSFPKALGTFNPGVSMTLSIWAKWEGLHPDSHQQILSKRNSWGNTTMMWQFGLNSNGYLRLESVAGAAQFKEGLTADTWTHLAVSISGGNLSTLYVDGVVASANVKTALGSGKQAQVILGGADAAGSEPFYGRLQSLRIYSNELDSSEVLALYQRGR